MNPSSARHLARHVCWFKAARSIESAAAEAAERLTDAWRDDETAVTDG